MEVRARTRRRLRPTRQRHRDHRGRQPAGRPRLGYFFDPDRRRSQRCLTAQRAARRERLRAMAERLAECGVPVDIEHLLSATRAGRAVGRPALAEAMVAAGHVRSTARRVRHLDWRGRPGLGPARGPAVREVVAVLHELGDSRRWRIPCSTRTRRRDCPAGATRASMRSRCITASTCPPTWSAIARSPNDLGMLVTGGSDYHGEHPARARATVHRVLGQVRCPTSFGRLLAARPKRRLSC